MEKSQRIPFLDKMTNKSSTKVGMNFYNKPTDSKRYLRFTLNHSWHCLTNIPFSIARRIYKVAENESIKEKRS